MVILRIPRCCGDFSVSRPSSLVSGGPRLNVGRASAFIIGFLFKPRNYAIAGSSLYVISGFKLQGKIGIA